MPQIPDLIEAGESATVTMVTNADGSVAEEHEFKWLKRGLSGTVAAKAFIKDLAPMFNGKGYRRSRTDARPIGGEWYELSASYLNQSVQLETEVGDTPLSALVPGSLEMDLSGQQEHVTQAAADEASSSDGRPKQTAYKRFFDAAWNPLETEDPDPPDIAGAIGFNGQQVAGCDKLAPAMSWTETWHVPARDIFRRPPDQRKRIEGTDQFETIKGKSYLELIRATVGKTNRDDPDNDKSASKRLWRGFDPGDVLFMGARFSINKGATMVPVAFAFSARETVRDFYVGGVQVTKKRGWDHLWVEYETSSQSASVVSLPLRVWVARVYDGVDFADLGLGSDWPELWLENQEFDDPALFLQQLAAS